MMISPEMYVEGLRDLELPELISKRDELMEFICDFEDRCIDFDKRKLVIDEIGYEFDPGPDVMYQMYLQYIAGICNLICEKFNREYIWGAK